MYSMVLMLALTGGADTIDSHRQHGCHGGGGGCYGASYGGYSGCYGGTFGAGCSGWLASASYGCHGGYAACYGGGSGCHERHRLLGGRRHNACHGGYGGCYGGGYGGCYGGGYGGCYGGGVVVGGCYGGVPVMGGHYPQMAPDMKKDMPKGEGIGAPKDDKKGALNVAAPATILVTLPADARLSVDGVATSSTSSVRVFATPVLQPGHNYSYTLTAEMVRNGETVRTEQRVPVTAGQTSNVTLDFPAATQRVASR